MPKGLVIKSTGSWYTVMHNGNLINCRIKGKFRIKGIRTSTPVTVGDYVQFEITDDDNTGIISSIDKRKNYIIRKATRFHHESHLIAANIDQAFLMVSLKSPATPFEFIDRFLISAEMFFIPVKILVNKTDLIGRDTLNEFCEIYTKAGYECFPLSVATGNGVEGIFKDMKGKITLIAGNSGVGKSSLIKAINPDINLKIDDISDYHQSGKHTTTFSEIFKLDQDCYVIDTPGLRSFGLIDINKSEIGLYFKDVFHNSGDCKFYNCTHIHEPGCAVIKAVEDGKIALSRYKSYFNIFTNEESKYRQGY